MRTTIVHLSVLLLLASTALGADRQLTGVEVFPAQVDLTTAKDRQTLVVQATYDDGITEDVTAQSEFGLDDPRIASLQENVLLPASDGQTTLVVRYGGQAISVPVAVEQASTQRPETFALDVLPVLSKAGCNMGSCHGAARGKDGFQLSLYGFDPQGDYGRITRQEAGRRINLALPRESLLLTKATGMSIHTGGELFPEDSELYETMLTWIQDGARPDPEGLASVTDVDIYPNSAVLNGRGATQQLIVRASYSDGTTRDVTHLAFFMTNNETSAAIEQSGVVTAGERGEAFLTARFDAFTVGMPVIVLPKDQPFTWPNTPESNYIDTLVHAKLKKLRMTPSEVCSDEVFLRRVYLDIIGLLPTVEEYERFMSDPSADKRETLVDELLARPEFTDLWVMKWAELLQIRTENNRGLSDKGALLFHHWIRDKIASNTPMDEMVQELLASNGSGFEEPQTNYYNVERDTLKITENVAQVFMGMRIQCAQCHNHPFDRWTMNDYYGFAAFFAQVGRKTTDDPRDAIIYNRGGGDVRHPVTRQNMTPKFLGGSVAETQGEDRREVLAGWLASKDNPYFANNLANIVWAHFFGRGIIEPVDDVRVTNPASNRPLLDELGNRFASYDFDFRRLVKDICTSRTYQLATQTNESNKRDETNFSHALLRRIRAEVFLDSIAQVTDNPNKFRGLPLGSRAVEIVDGRYNDYFLTTFGRASRETVCSCEVSMEPNLSQALHLMNGTTVQTSLTRGKVVPNLLAEGLNPHQVVEQLYLRTVSRRPNERELAAVDAALAEGGNRTEVLEDVFWALLNSREFLFNH